MILDGLLTFTGDQMGATSTIAVASTWTDAPTTGTQYASNYIDLGVKSGVPSSANGGGARDLGIGDDPSLKLLIEVTTTFVYAAGSGTTYFALQGGVDDGSGGITWGTDMWTSPTYAQTSLTQGTYCANVDVPRPVPGQALPRFLRLKIVTAVATYTAGAIYAGIVIDRFDQTVGTTGKLSGYPAGINVAN
jgi:hypothetical protein